MATTSHVPLFRLLHKRGKGWTWDGEALRQREKPGKTMHFKAPTDRLSLSHATQEPPLQMVSQRTEEGSGWRQLLPLSERENKRDGYKGDTGEVKSIDVLGEASRRAGTFILSSALRRCTTSCDRTPEQSFLILFTERLVQRLLTR